jgi:type VI secretion system protein ImpE
MTPNDLLKAGKLNEAIGALSDELRRDPGNAQSRAFLFELLCFSGEYDRAQKQLDVLSRASKQSEMGGLLYRGLLQATLTRQDVFSKERAPEPATAAAPGPVSGILNGSPFSEILDADPRVGAHLEVLAAGAYLKIPFSLLASLECGPPKRLRDMLWIPAVIRTTAAFQGRELGEAFLPALTPFAALHSSDGVRLGRETVWEEGEDGELRPVGQKLLLVDGEEIPILEVRKLDFREAAAAAS